jgi:hypothetical protein
MKAIVETTLSSVFAISLPGTRTRRLMQPVKVLFCYRVSLPVLAH